MIELISQHYPLKDNQSSTPHGQHLTNIEENALRYIAGYICKKIQDQVVQFSHPHRQALLLFISDMAGIEMDNSQTESWTNIMDRGGLHHVNDMAYHFFYSQAWPDPRMKGGSGKLRIPKSGLLQKFLQQRK